MMERVIEKESTGLVVYEDYRTQIADFKKLNETLVFDYESKKGNAAAKTHIGKMKKSIKAIDRVRIDEAKAYKLKINNEADALTRQVLKMIKVHQDPLDKFDNAEKIRIAVIEARIQIIFDRDPGTTAEEIQKEMNYISGIEMDDSWDELLAKAVTSQFDRVSFLKEKLDTRIQYETDQAELEAFRAKEKREAEEFEDDFDHPSDTVPDEAKDETDVAKNNAVDSDVKSNTPVKVSSSTRKTYNNKPPLRAYDDDPALQTEEAVKPKLTMKEKREEAQADFIGLGFDKDQATLIVRLISFNKLRHINFAL